MDQVSPTGSAEPMAKGAAAGGPTGGNKERDTGAVAANNSQRQVGGAEGAVRPISSAARGPRSRRDVVVAARGGLRALGQPQTLERLPLA